MVIAAYDGWRKLHSRGWKVAKQFAVDHDLHVPTLEAMKDLRMQFVKVLEESECRCSSLMLYITIRSQHLHFRTCG